MTRIPGDAIKIVLPEAMQCSVFSCGAAVTHSVCAYWGIGPFNYTKNLKTDEINGTSVQNIVKFMTSKGLNTIFKENMTKEDVIFQLDKKRPIITLIQAWGSKKIHYRKNLCGHYVIIIGYDEKKVYLEDPWLIGIRGYLTWKQFERRWHDIGVDNHLYNKIGIISWKKGIPGYLNKAKKID